MSSASAESARIAHRVVRRVLKRAMPEVGVCVAVTGWGRRDEEGEGERDGAFVGAERYGEDGYEDEGGGGAVFGSPGDGGGVPNMCVMRGRPRLSMCDWTVLRRDMFAGGVGDIVLSEDAFVVDWTRWWWW